MIGDFTAYYQFLYIIYIYIETKTNNFTPYNIVVVYMEQFLKEIPRYILYHALGHLVCMFLLTLQLSVLMNIGVVALLLLLLLVVIVVMVLIKNLCMVP